MESKLEGLRGKVLAELEFVQTRPKHPETSWHAGIVDAWVRAAGDPDTEFVEWLYTGCPLGAAEDVLPGGVFPQLSRPEEIDSLDQYIAEVEPGANYRSVEDQPHKAGAELDRLVGLGFAKFFGNLDWKLVNLYQL